MFSESRWLESDYHAQDTTWIVGIDEAGRGPLAGPVVAASVLLPTDHTLEGLDDSKRLTEARRRALFDDIHEQALAVGTSMVSAAEIDEINILQASLKAMRLSLDQLCEKIDRTPQIVLVDGNQRFDHSLPIIPVVKGDQRSQNIAAASIVAKVLRDKVMEAYHGLYPQFDFLKHKGYPTPQHKQALVEYGASPLHRISFRGVLPIKE